MLIAGKMRGQGGFSLVELLTVILVIGIGIGIGVIMVVRSSAGTSVRAAAEIVKEDLRKVYSLADAGKNNGEENGEDINMKRDRYIAVFHDDTGVPPNAFKIRKETWNGTAYVPAPDDPPDIREENRIVTGTNWIMPSTDSDIRIKLPGGVTEYEFTFQSRGSVMTVDPAGEKYIIIETQSESGSKRIDISDYGDITSI